MMDTESNTNNVAPGGFVPPGNVESQAMQILVINRLQLVMAEKRTTFSLMRIGVSMLALGLAIFSALIATSKYYDPNEVWGYLIVVVAVSVGILIVGMLLLGHSMIRIYHYDRMINAIKERHPDVRDMVEN